MRRSLRSRHTLICARSTEKGITHRTAVFGFANGARLQRALLGSSAASKRCMVSSSRALHYAKRGECSSMARLIGVPDTGNRREAAWFGWPVYKPIAVRYRNRQPSAMTSSRLTAFPGTSAEASPRGIRSIQPDALADTMPPTHISPRRQAGRTTLRAPGSTRAPSDDFASK
jgi:hypothetical protein